MTMMLATSALELVGSVFSVFSPSRNPCMRRVAPRRYRNDPYNAPVLQFHAITPTNFGDMCNYGSAIGNSQQCTTPSSYLTQQKDVPIILSPSAGSYTSSQQCFVKLPVAPAAVSFGAPDSNAPSMASLFTTKKELSSNYSMTSSTSTKSTTTTVAATRYAYVRFKHESVTFIAPFRISVGDTVVVQGDRGENIGIVDCITTEVPSFEVKNQIIRRATEQDKEALASQRKKEEAAVRQIQLLSDQLGLRASIEDAEFQFDLNKLTVFVRRNCKNAFVDFRKLQRSLFREFRCRIWCAYMDEVEEAAKAPRFQ